MTSRRRVSLTDLATPPSTGEPGDEGIPEPLNTATPQMVEQPATTQPHSPETVEAREPATPQAVSTATPAHTPRQAGGVVAAAPVATPSAGVGEPVDDTVALSTRIPVGLRRRLKAHAGINGLQVQDVVVTALEQYLDRHQG